MPMNVISPEGELIRVVEVDVDTASVPRTHLAFFDGGNGVLGDVLPQPQNGKIGPFGTPYPDS